MREESPRIPAYQKVSRRKFIQASAVAATWTLPKFAIGKSATDLNRLNIACVGVGGYAKNHVLAAQAENLVAFCDVDWRSGRSAFKTAASYPGIKRYVDFREMLDTQGKEIDAVMIGTPDHTHFPIAMAAMELGKHVFVQKPLAHNLWQVNTLRKAMHHYGVKTAMGNQGRAMDGIRLVKEWVDSGIVGEVREIHCWTDRPGKWSPFRKQPVIPPPPESVPEGLNWDLWQGPVMERPYSSKYLPSNWRGWWKYGAGPIGDLGCHFFDAPFYALELGMPDSIDVQLDEPPNPEYTGDGVHLVYHFPARKTFPPVDLHWYEGRPRPPLLEGMKELPLNGMYMLGSKEIVYHEEVRAQSPMLWPRDRMKIHKDKLLERPIPRIEGGHFKEFFRSVKGEGPDAGSNFDYAAPLTEMVLLGSIAIRAGYRIEWDPVAKRIANRPELNEWLKESVRSGWEYGETL